MHIKVSKKIFKNKMNVIYLQFKVIMFNIIILHLLLIIIDITINYIALIH